MTESEGTNPSRDAGRNTDEQFESIPWDALVVDDSQRRRRIVGLVVAAVLVFGGAVGITSLLNRSGQGDPAVVAASVTSTLASGASPDTSPDGAEGESVLGANVSEEDLTATDPDAGRAGAYAAWFAADYFTLDGSEITRTAIRDRLPEGSEVPEPSKSQRSFVESAVPIEVVAIDENQYRVVILVRSLAANDGETYERQLAKAVEVIVRLDESGFSIVDLPAPVAVPDGKVLALDVTEEDAPPEILEAARQRARAWGEPSESFLSVGRSGSSWRVVLDVTDPVGMTWPVAIWLTDGGGLAIPDLS